MNNKDLLYKKLNALRLEVDSSIVDDIISTVDATFNSQHDGKPIVMCCKDYFIQKLNEVNTAITNGTYTGSYLWQVRIKERIESALKFIDELEAL